ncbi:MAG: hypothetical protein ACYCQI_10700 [Gammaproteobacteria bacterium]
MNSSLSSAKTSIAHYGHNPDPQTLIKILNDMINAIERVENEVNGLKTEIQTLKTSK